jgi:hypothetical protein
MIRSSWLLVVFVVAAIGMAREAASRTAGG